MELNNSTNGPNPGSFLRVAKIKAREYLAPQEVALAVSTWAHTPRALSRSNCAVPHLGHLWSERLLYDRMNKEVNTRMSVAVACWATLSESM